VAEPDSPPTLRGARDPFDALIVVVEPRPAWAPDLQRCLANQRILVRRCLPWPKLPDVVRPDQPAVILVELSPDPAGCLTWLSRRHLRTTDPPVMVLADPDTVVLQWQALELGATVVLPAWRPAGEMARLCQRLLGRR
jgi:DNA-binding response OmpR family regulator